MDQTRKQSTNVASPSDIQTPVNQIARWTAISHAKFRRVVRPNADTLYTSAWIDLSHEPLVLHVPDTKGRFYVMEMLVAYSNVFASPGKRTTGTQAQDFAIVGPGWQGQLPAGVTRIDAPTNMV